MIGAYLFIVFADDEKKKIIFARIMNTNIA
jgi:hypothetical protein